jgi:hypothetical protein
MDPGDGPEDDTLGQLHDLLTGLSHDLPSGGLLGWAGPGETADVPGEVYGVIGNAGLLGDGHPAAASVSRSVRARPAYAVNVPADAAALMSLMWEVDEQTAIGLLTDLTASTGTNRPRQRGLRRRDVREPGDIFAEIAVLIGPSARWWTNTDLTTWNPVTANAFDAVVVGAGNGSIVTLVAFEGGG